MESADRMKKKREKWLELSHCRRRSSALQHDNVSARTDGRNDRGDSPTNEWGADADGATGLNKI